MSRFKGFVRVASSYDLMDIRMAVAALEGADILTISPGTELGNTMPHASLALGPLEIYVPEKDADEAVALLTAVAAGTVIPHDQRDLVEDETAAPLTRDATIGDKIRNLLGFLVGGVSQPLRGVLFHKKPKEPRD